MSDQDAVVSGVAAGVPYVALPPTRRRCIGRRQLPGGLEEFMRLGHEDAVLKAFEPQVTQAVEEFPAVFDELRARLPVKDGPIGVVGASIGTLPVSS